MADIKCSKHTSGVASGIIHLNVLIKTYQHIILKSNKVFLIWLVKKIQAII